MLRSNERMSLGIDGNSLEMIGRIVSRDPRIVEWNRASDGVEMVKNMARMVLERGAHSGHALTARRERGWISDEESFGWYGGLGQMSDDMTVNKTVGSLDWKLEQNLTSRLALARVSMISGKRDGCFAVLPVFADEVVDKMNNDDFTLYYNTVSTYLRYVAGATQEIGRWQRGNIRVTWGWTESSSDSELGPGSSYAMNDLLDVNRQSMLKVLNQYVESDNIARMKTGAVLSTSARFHDNLNETVRRWRSSSNFSQPGSGVVEVGNSEGVNWLQMPLLDVIAAEAEYERCYHLAHGMRNVAESGIQLSGVVNNIIDKMSSDHRPDVRRCLYEMTSLCSQSSALVALELLSAAMPWAAGDEMRGYWLRALAE